MLWLSPNKDYFVILKNSIVFKIVLQFVYTIIHLLSICIKMHAYLSGLLSSDCVAFHFNLKLR